MQSDIYLRIVRPILTEKSHDLTDLHNKVVFEVDPNANVLEVKKAIEQIFKVKVIKINSMNFRGKIKRIGRFAGQRRNWKKVIATLKEGDAINFFLEGV